MCRDNRQMSKNKVINEHKERKMSITKRQGEILKVVEDNLYISVNELAELTFTSPSSIRRDLTALQNLGLVRRSHGGVGLSKVTDKVAGFYSRVSQNIKEKRLIAKKAASLLRDGQSILLDSSSTASFLLPYIARLESPILFTNNLETAISAVKQGINTHCLGGASVGGSVALGGSETYRALSAISVDILFFSSQSLDKNGLISDSTEEENYSRELMLKRAKTKVFLCDSEKFGRSSLYKLTSLDEVDFAVLGDSFKELKTSATIL